MPGDPAVIKGVPATLSATDLLKTVAVKLPPFWPDNIKTWFVQTKSQFQLKGVVLSQTKFDYCVQSMTQKVYVKVLNLSGTLPKTFLIYISRTGCSGYSLSTITFALRQLLTYL